MITSVLNLLIKMPEEKHFKDVGEIVGYTSLKFLRHRLCHQIISLTVNSLSS